MNFHTCIRIFLQIFRHALHIGELRCIHHGSTVAETYHRFKWTISSCSYTNTTARTTIAFKLSNTLFLFSNHRIALGQIFVQEAHSLQQIFVLICRHRHGRFKNRRTRFRTKTIHQCQRKIKFCTFGAETLIVWFTIVAQIETNIRTKANAPASVGTKITSHIKPTFRHQIVSIRTVAICSIENMSPACRSLRFHIKQMGFTRISTKQIAQIETTHHVNLRSFIACQQQPVVPRNIIPIHTKGKDWS